MRTALAAGACALLVAGLALAPGAGVGPHASRAEAADCAWNRHAKRVVKHLRRHGRPRRVVHTRHWWRCDPVPLAPVAGPTPVSQLPAPIPSQPEPEANRVGVSAHDQGGDLGYVLTRPGVRAGRVTVELNNQGEDPHNLNLQRQGDAGEPVFQLANTPPGKQEVAGFELPAGTYRLWCNLPEHDEKGMHTTLVVE